MERTRREIIEVEAAAELRRRREERRGFGERLPGLVGEHTDVLP